MMMGVQVRGRKEVRGGLTCLGSHDMVIDQARPDLGLERTAAS